ncbi:MAG: tRNA 2-thiocytidine(32) synthetase TtcA [Flavobacteriales bacterium]
MEISDQELMEKTTHRIRKNVWSAVNDFTMIVPGDKIMVCLSGGKDSFTMLDMLLHIRLAMKNSFEIIAVNLDQKQPGFPEHILPEYLRQLDVPYRILERDTYSVVKEKVPEGKTMCSLCSRLRRGILYDAASEMNCTKIALGHHQNDILETFFLNLFFAGKMEAMPAKYRTDDARHVVIRPLAYVREKDIEFYSAQRGFPIIPCNLCGSQENMQRKVIKRMMTEWEEKYPDRQAVMFNALGNISLSHLFDRDLYDFAELQSIINVVSEPNHH